MTVEKGLEEIPHFEVLDLSMIFRLLISTDKEGISSSVVENNLMKTWDITAEELKEQAEKNTPKLFPENVQTMASVMTTYFKGMGQNVEIGEPLADEPDMNKIHIVTNTKGIDGFSVVLYPQTLKKLSGELGDSLYILPSSRHEALVLPAESNLSGRKLSKMVGEINATVLEESDIISDNVYLYHRKTDRIMIADAEEKDTMETWKGDGKLCAAF